MAQKADKAVELELHTLLDDFFRDLHPGAEPDVSANARLDELGVDSLSLMDLLLLLERRFDIEIPDESLPGISTVGDLLDVVTAARSSTPHSRTPSGKD